MIKVITKISVGGGLAQAIQFLALPFLSTLYSPQIMGAYFTATMLASIASVLMTFQLQHAIPNKISSDEIRDLFWSLFLIAFSTLFILSFLLIITNGASKPLFLWAIVFAFTTALTNVIRSTLIRLGRFNLINISTLIRAIFITVGQFVFHEISEDLGIFVGFFIGDLVAVSTILFLIRSNWTLRLPKSGFLSKTIANQKNIFVYGTFQEIVAVSTLSLPLIIVTEVFGDVMAGQFGMAQRLMLPPAAIILGAIVNVIHHSYGRREKYAIVESAIIRPRNVVAFIAIASIFAFWAARFICDVILSDKWDLSVWTSSYIAIWAVFLIASAPFRACCRMYSKQHIQLAVDLMALIALTISFLVGEIVNLDYTNFVVIFVIIGVAQNLGIFLVVRFFVLNKTDALRKPQKESKIL